MNNFYVFLIFKIFKHFIEEKLPDESCRHCGGSLINYAQCAECKIVISMICKSCGTKTEEQFHSGCLFVLNRPHLISENTIKNPKSIIFA
jgi:hypothetical protein